MSERENFCSGQSWGASLSVSLSPFPHSKLRSKRFFFFLFLKKKKTATVVSRMKWWEEEEAGGNGKDAQGKLMIVCERERLSSIALSQFIAIFIRGAPPSTDLLFLVPSLSLSIPMVFLFHSFSCRFPNLFVSPYLSFEKKKRKRKGKVLAQSS